MTGLPATLVTALDRLTEGVSRNELARRASGDLEYLSQRRQLSGHR